MALNIAVNGGFLHYARESDACCCIRSRKDTVGWALVPHAESSSRPGLGYHFISCGRRMAQRVMSSEVQSIPVEYVTAIKSAFGFAKGTGIDVIVVACSGAAF